MELSIDQARERKVGRRVGPLVIIIAQTRKETQGQLDFSGIYFLLEMCSSKHKFRDKAQVEEEEQEQEDKE